VSVNHEFKLFDLFGPNELRVDAISSRITPGTADRKPGAAFGTKGV